MTRAINETTTVSVYRYEAVARCEVVNYSLPDTGRASRYNVTTTVGNTTVTSLVETTIPATVETGPSIEFSSTAIANDSTVYELTSTWTDPNAAPSSAWSVTVCTFAGP